MATTRMATHNPYPAVEKSVMCISPARSVFSNFYARMSTCSAPPYSSEQIRLPLRFVHKLLSC